MSDDAPRQDPVGESLTATTIGGLRWTYFEAVATAGSQAVYVAVMSRLLDPVAFGLMAIANLSLVFGFFVTQMGVANALIQRPKIDDDDIRAAFSTSLVLGVLIALLFLFAAPVVGRLFNEPDAVAVLRAMAVTFLFTGMQMTSQGLLRRRLQFKRMAIAGTVAMVSGFVVGVALALLGAGVWSLVGAVLVSTCVKTGLYYAAARHPLLPRLGWGAYRALFSYGSRSTSLRFMEFLGGNLDTFAVGRFTDTFTLGLYNRAYYLVKLPLGTYLSTSLSKVLFPGFSRIQADGQRMRRVYTSALLLGGIVVYPLCAGIAVAHRELIMVVLGDQWVAAAVFVPFFALGTGLSLMSRIGMLLCEARAELNKALMLEVGSLCVLATSLGIATLGDTWAFAAALAATEIVRHVAYQVLLRRLIAVTFNDLWRAYVPPFVAAIWTAALIAAGRQTAMLLQLPSAIVLVIEILLGMVALITFVRWSPFARVRGLLSLQMAAAGLLNPARPARLRVARLLLGAVVRTAQDGTEGVSPSNDAAAVGDGQSEVKR